MNTIEYDFYKTVYYSAAKHIFFYKIIELLVVGRCNIYYSL